MGFLSKIIAMLRGHGKEGQHTLEYAILLILVMAGIVTMGRYVIRSWNANLQGWADSALDSMEDPLIEAEPISLPTCTESNWAPAGCGFGILNFCTGLIASCPITSNTEIKSWRPSECQCDTCATDECIINCIPDICCCEIPVAIACETTAGDTEPPTCTSTGLSPPNTGGGCPPGSMGYSVVCGGTTYYGCKQDISCPIFCPIENKEMGGGAFGFFGPTLEGTTGTSQCLGIYTGGPAAYDCLAGGIWGTTLSNPCVLTCGNGICEPLLGENCLDTCGDCGVECAYGGCPTLVGSVWTCS